MRFNFHYNKPLSKRLNTVIWSVHYRGKCRFGRSINCRVPVESRIHNQQPVAVMVGEAKKIVIRRGCITIT